MYVTHRTRTTKRTALAMLQSAIDAGGDIDAATLSELVNALAPRKAHKPLDNSLRWVALACATTDARASLQCLHVVNGVAYGCDGNRLHYAPTDRPDGAYDAKTGDLIEDAPQPPDFTQVIPKPGAHNDAVRLGDFRALVTPTTRTAPDVTLVHPDNDCLGVFELYAHDATNGSGDGAVLWCNGESFVGEHDLGKFVVMGRRV